MQDTSIEQARQLGRAAADSVPLTLEAAVDIIADRHQDRSQAVAANLLDGHCIAYLGATETTCGEAVITWIRTAIAALERRAETILAEQRGADYAAGIASGLDVRSTLPNVPVGVDQAEYRYGFEDGQAALVRGDESDDEHPSLQIF